MIATGFLFWLESRRASHAKKGLAGVRVVEALTIGSVTGIVMATLAFFVVNWLLPLDVSFAGVPRAELEVWTFYLVWLASFAHAAWRRADPATQPARRAWREQCWGIAVLAVAAVVLNGITTGHHLAHTLGQGIASVAGMDLLLLALAAGAALTARHLGCGAVQKEAARADKAPLRDTPAPAAARVRRTSWSCVRR